MLRTRQLLGGYKKFKRDELRDEGAFRSGGRRYAAEERAMGGEEASRSSAGAGMIRRVVTIRTAGRRIRHRRYRMIHARAGWRGLGRDGGHRKQQSGEGKQDFHRP